MHWPTKWGDVINRRPIVKDAYDIWLSNCPITISIGDWMISDGWRYTYMISVGNDLVYGWWRWGN